MFTIDGKIMNGTWRVKQIITKCPNCGKEYTDEGIDAENCFGGSMTCECGFEGELPDG